MTTTSPARARSVAPVAVTAGLLVLLAVAVALALLPVPVPVRSLVVVPALVLVAGQAATPLVIGRRPLGNAELDRVLRAALPVLLGVLVLLGSVLLTAVIGFDLDTTSMALGTAAAGAVLVLVSRWRTLVPGVTAAGPRPVRLPAASTLRTAGAAVVSALVLAGSVAGAIALIPTPTEAYSLVTLDDSPVLAGSPLQVAPGGRAELHWTLRGFDHELDGGDPAVTVTVGGTPAADVMSTADPVTPGRPDDVGATSRRSGTTTFTAPATAGLYAVQLTVDDGDAVPGELDVTMQVHP